jgi:ribosomal-protein-alanine N-acetyltransferase
MYSHMGTIPLETDRLILRRFTFEDADAMFHTWASDEDVPRYMRWDAHKTVDETENAIAAWLGNYEKKDFYLWALAIKETNAPIGTLGMFCVNSADMCYEVAYSLGKGYWNKGYMTEALKAVLVFGLKTIGINRIEAYHSINNPASGKVLQKSGMKYEGRLRQKYKSHMGFEDCDMYAVLKNDLNII